MNIRPFEAADAEGVASLWQYWFKDKGRVPEPALTALVRRIYIEDPNVDEEIRPLVAEDGEGKMLGFLGVSVMPVLVDGEESRMAGVFPSVVDPDAPTTVASFLLRRFLAGPQALTFSDGGHVKFERIWETLGGQIAQLQSLRWVRLLRPMEGGATFGAIGKALRPVRPVVRALARGGDHLLRSAAGRRLAVRAEQNPLDQGYTSEPLTPAALAAVAPELHARAKARLRPIYTEAHTAWQFGEMTKIVELGEFTARLVRAPDGKPAGWFVYYLKPGGVSRVFALEADDRHLAAVTDVLFLDADVRGAAALLGRMEPRLRRVISERTDLVYPKGSLQMVHSKDQSLMADAQLGRLGFNRLQGENWYWWALDSKVVP